MTYKTIFPTHFSPSMLSDIYRCEMYFFRQYCQCFVGRVKNPDLIAGGHIAKACEITRNAFFTGGLSETDAIELGSDHILESEDTGDRVKSNENVALAFRKYFTKFKLSSELEAASLADGTHAVEYKFLFDMGIPHPALKGTNILFTGRLDYLGQKITTAGYKYYGVDEKTCKQIARIAESKAPDYAKELQSYRTSTQIMAYAWAAQQLGITLESFLIRRIPIMNEFNPSFELEVPLNQFMIDTWYRSTRARLLALTEKYKTYVDSIQGVSDRHPHEVFQPSYDTTSCIAYSRPCAYLDGCTYPEGELMIANRFMQRVYDREKRIEVTIEDYIKQENL